MLIWCLRMDYMVYLRLEMSPPDTPTPPLTPLRLQQILFRRSPAEEHKAPRRAPSSIRFSMLRIRNVERCFTSRRVFPPQKGLHRPVFQPRRTRSLPQIQQKRRSLGCRQWLHVSRAPRSGVVDTPMPNTKPRAERERDRTKTVSVEIRWRTTMTTRERNHME